MYEDRYVRRGEIYRVRLDTGWDSEQGATRPALIISSDAGNRTSPCVIVAYLTTKDHEIGVRFGPTKATGIPSYVCCEQLATVSKKRITGNIMGSLSPNEMKEVESKLDEVLDLGYIDDAPVKEKEQEINALKLQMAELKSEVFRLKTSLDAKADEILTRDVEIAVHKRMYEKAVGIIAAMRAEPDMPENPRFRKVETPKVPPESPKNPEPPTNPEPVETQLVDINTASFNKLRSVGMSNNVVLAVIDNRPYTSVEDLKKVPGVNAKMYGIIEKKVCCVPVKVEEQGVTITETAKVNVNTASAQEIHDFTGLHMTACYAITGKRNQIGRFISLDELVIPGRLSAKLLEKYRDKLEV